MSTTAPDNWFQGYHREDGTVGIRNMLLVLSTVALTNRWAELIAQSSDDAYVLSGDFLRGLRGDDAAVQDGVLQSFAVHPNVGATLILCFDKASSKQWQAWAKQQQRPVEVITMIEQGGMQSAVDAGKAALARMDARRGGAVRAPAPLSALTVALECGGSDATSALCSNPAIGRFVDRLVEAGGTAIVSETAEFIGTEPVIHERAVNETVRDQVLQCIQDADDRMSTDSSRYRGVNPTAENIEAGLTTLIEKSMGAVCKIGERKIDGCLGFGQRPSEAGMYFMDTPFFSPVSLTGMAAAGAQITLFSIGVFNPAGHPFSPTIKISGNPATVKTWSDIVDVDVSGIIDGSETLDDAAQHIATVAQAVANGEATKNESWADGLVVIPKTCRLI